MYDNYSVLMSVYKSEKPENLIIALDSIINQTYKSNEIILVQDGPITKQLQKVIDYYKEDLKIIKLSKNVGLGNALNIGLNSCTNELILRMDTDDYSVPYRAEKMIKVMLEYEDIDVLGTSVKEFSNSITDIKAIKIALEENEEIYDMFKYRNPINHPSVLFRKSSVMKVGGYKDMKFNEDYYLWVRLAIQGAKFANLSEPLVYMRINEESYSRRRGYDYYKVQKKLFKFMRNNSFISYKQYLFNNLVRFITKVMIPTKVMQKIYINFLRK